MLISAVIGLGNPEPKYAGTRHNIGFDVLNHMCNDWRADRKLKALVGEYTIDNERLLLCKPQTYMNASGESVLPLVQKYKLKPGAVLVIHDELDIGFGNCKAKLGGGDAGHNGLRSVTAMIGKDYQRLRVGIGRPYDGTPIIDYVLGRYSLEQRESIGDVIEKAVAAVKILACDGMTETQKWLRQNS